MTPHGKNWCAVPAAAELPCAPMYGKEGEIALQVLNGTLIPDLFFALSQCLPGAPAASVDDLLAPPEQLVRLLLERGVRVEPAIHAPYHISLHSSSFREPRYPLLRVVSASNLATALKPEHQCVLQARFGSVLVWPAHGASSLLPHKSVEQEDRLPRGPHDLLSKDRLLEQQATPYEN